MERFYSRRSPAVILLACVLLASSACSGSGEEPEKKSKPAVALTPLNRACGGILDKETVAEMLDRPRGKKLERGAQAELAVDKAAEVGRYLGEEMDWSRHSKSTCFIDDESGGSAEIDIYFGWWPGPLPPKDAKPGESAVFVAKEGSSELLVDCRRTDLVESGKKGAILRGVITDRVGLSSNASAKLLIASARKVAEGLNCENQLTFPDPPERQKGLK
ncbi:hypothetical protein ACFYRC_04080 [Streptomyces sp. NPDC005279]|uniref:hypothetical protein n=1 Tax=Streptomyces sp. NPDC005279 TaxID=3364712 RepID=UPI00367E2AC5